jgi:hypothetical protein
MHKEVAALRAFIETEIFLSGLDSVDSASIDDLLDARDSEPFEAPWVRVYTALENLQTQKPLSKDETREETAFRKDVFQAAYTTAGGETAGSISDDFGLFWSALRNDFQDDWLNALWLAYKAGEFPHGELTPVPGKLATLIV